MTVEPEPRHSAADTIGLFLAAIALGVIAGLLFQLWP